MNSDARRLCGDLYVNGIHWHADWLIDQVVQLAGGRTHKESKMVEGEA